jgi:hypothetical protein
MSKILGMMAAFALLAMLALPGSATAAERRADGLKVGQPGAETEFSSYHRRWHRRHWVVRRAWGPRFGYYRPWYRPYYAGYGFYRPWRPFYRPWYRPWYAGYGYPYYRPGFSIGFGFGPRWGWGW